MAKIRYVPPKSTEVQEGKVTAYLYTNTGGQPCMVAYYGRATNPSFHYRYKDEAARKLALDKFIQEKKDVEEVKANRRVTAKASAKAAAIACKVGDIFRSTWGYDQTNVDYYQVVETQGMTIKVREIAQLRLRDGGGMSGRCVPDVGNFVGEVLTKRINAGSNFVYFRVNSFSTATKITPIERNGVKVFESSYWSNYA